MQTTSQLGAHGAPVAGLVNKPQRGDSLRAQEGDRVP